MTIPLPKCKNCGADYYPRHNDSGLCEKCEIERAWQQREREQDRPGWLRADPKQRRQR